MTLNRASHLVVQNRKAVIHTECGGGELEEQSLYMACSENLSESSSWQAQFYERLIGLYPPKSAISPHRSEGLWGD